MFNKIIDYFFPKNILETDRIILRNWKKSDLQDLFLYAKDKRIGLNAGWKPHENLSDSRDYLNFVKSKKYTYAVIPKSIGRPVGSISLMIGKESNFEIPNNEAEIGFWIGHPFWGNGYIPEATNKLIDFGFNELNLNKIWCGYFDGNNNSKRVQEKCGFKFHHTQKDVYWNALKELKTEHIMLLTREDYNNEISNESN